MISGPYIAMIDANLHRFKEGARVLEDLSRFVLRDYDLFVQFKTLKHQVVVSHPHLTETEDMGKDLIEDNQRQNILALALANGCRIQEAARVLEEILGGDYKAIRFRAYALNAQLITKLKIALKHDKLSGIYALCDPTRYSIEYMAKEINQLGISICQIRMKLAPKRQIINAVKTMRTLLNSEVLLIVNDHLDVALNYADGVHLGQTDLPILDARKIAPLDFIIGATCSTLEQAKIAIAHGASYLACGCLYPTQTKKDTSPISFETLKEIAQYSTIPVGAIGGIQKEHIDNLKAINVSLFAMQSGLWEESMYRPATIC